MARVVRTPGPGKEQLRVFLEGLKTDKVGKVGWDKSAVYVSLGEPPAEEEVLERGPLKLDAKRLVASWNAVPVELTLTEFWMVHTLAKFPGHVKDRDQLMHDAKLVVDEGTITSHVKRIRRKFQAVDAAFDRIDTVYGMGYRWKA